MTVNAYLNFNGNCREAVEYYASVFETPEPDIMKFGDMPPDPEFDMSEETKELVMHVSLPIHDSYLMFSDSMPGQPVTFGKNISLTVVTDELEKMKAEFNKLSEEGKVIMPIDKTFWSPAYGMLEDRFGVVWQFMYDDGSMMADS
ncbi:MAG TPA: VOC family protein [Planococcus sp. (in: firmicutes)]|nr:VOC family protein [Planococcus sp. (in: firmicutes)]